MATPQLLQDLAATSQPRQTERYQSCGDQFTENASTYGVNIKGTLSRDGVVSGGNSTTGGKRAKYGAHRERVPRRAASTTKCIARRSGASRSRKGS
eukprot:scaffold1077_cov388-Prasinococcus_capsulatus_cf.AAC.8